VTTDSMPKVYVLTGHGEMDLDSTFTAALQKLNVETEDLDLLQQDQVPEDAAAVIVNGPTSDLSADDLTKLTAYADRSGNFFLVTNFTAQSDMPEFAALLAYYGVTAEQGVVIEQDSAHYYQNGAYLLPDLNQEAQITHEAVVGNGYVFTPYAQALSHPADGDGLAYTDLLTTTADSYNHTDITSQSMAKTDGDEEGPFTVGLSARKTVSAGSGVSEAVIISSPNILTANADNVVSGSNRKLFSGAMTELTGTETTVSIPAKSFSGPGLTMSARTALILGLIVIVLIPGFLLLFGGAVVLLRRRR
jgi:ABC-2 type transport system permease protein